MSNQGKTRYVFASSYTNQGFCTFIPELINGLSKVFILKGAPGSGKATFIRLVGEAMCEQGYDIEYWVSSLDPVNPDGVYITQLDVAVINGSLVQPIDPRYPGVREILINLGEYSQATAVQGNAQAITELLDTIRQSQEKAVRLTHATVQAKESIREVNSANLDKDKVAQLIVDLSNRILDQRRGHKHFFTRAITPEGVVNYIDEISSDCRQRYIFKGPPGSGKSMVVNELAAQAGMKGYSLEYYHCGSDADHLAMVIIRSLQLALIESDQAETVLRQGDVVIDMSRYLPDGGFDQWTVNGSAAYRRYETLLLQVQKELSEMQKKTSQVKKYYTLSMDFEKLDQKRLKVIAEILDSAVGNGC